MALLVQDPSPAVRRAAVAALAQMPGEARSRGAAPRARRRGRARCASPPPPRSAATADPAALDALERLLGDEDAGVRAAAVRAIAELARASTRRRGAGARRRAARRRARRSRAGRARGRRGLRADRAGAARSTPVRDVLGHADPEVVQSAVRCIRRHGGEERRRGADAAGLARALGGARRRDRSVRRAPRARRRCPPCCGVSTARRTSSCAARCCARSNVSRRRRRRAWWAPGRAEELAMTDAEFRMIAEFSALGCGLHFGQESRYLLERRDRAALRRAGAAFLHAYHYALRNDTTRRGRARAGRSTTSRPTRPTSCASGASSRR